MQRGWTRMHAAMTDCVLMGYFPETWQNDISVIELQQASVAAGAVQKTRRDQTSTES